MRSDVEYIKGAVDIDLTTTDAGDKKCEEMLDNDQQCDLLELLLTCQDYVICEGCITFEEMTRAVNIARTPDYPSLVPLATVREAYEQGLLCLRLIVWDN